MTAAVEPRARAPRPVGRYGIVAPWVPCLWIGLTALYVVFAVRSALSGGPWWGVALYTVGVLFFAAGAFSYLWRSIDQSGNSIEAAEANAAANGFADRISFVTGDMTALPFADDAFRLVTANVAIHNIPSAAGRATAVREAWRVLAPGGSLLIADIRRTTEYQRTLESLGAAVELRSAGPRMWWSGPWMSTRILRSVKSR